MGVDEVAEESEPRDTIAPPAADTDPHALAGDTGEETAMDPSRPLLILDRDGTLVDFVRDEEIGFVGTAFHPSQLRLLSGVVEGLQRLDRAGYRFAIATNQPGPAKGQYSADAVARTNDALVALLRDHDVHVEYVAVCMHHPEGGPGGDPSMVFACDCRKPKGGMFREILDALGAAPEATWVVGDQVSDVVAGRSVGARTALVVDVRRCELCPNKTAAAAPEPDLMVPSLTALADALLARDLEASGS